MQREDLTYACTGRICRDHRRRAGADQEPRAAGALHHQFGGAGLYGEHAARGRRDSVDDDLARGDRGLRRRRRCASGQSRHLRCRAALQRSNWRSARWGRGGMPWVLDPVFIERSPERAQFAQVLVGQGPTVVRLNHRGIHRPWRRRCGGRCAGAFRASPQDDRRADRRDRPGDRRRAVAPRSRTAMR